MGQGRLLFCRSLVEAAHKYNTGGELQATKTWKITCLQRKLCNPSKAQVF